MHAQGEAKKKPEKTFILQVDSQHSESVQNYEMKQKQYPQKTQQTLGMAENLISRTTTLLYSNVYKKSQGTQRNQNVWLIQRKKINQQKLFLKNSLYKINCITDS